MRWIPQTWNDILSIGMIIGLPVYWTLATPNELVTGATIAGWTLCVQFYFRKSPDAPGPEQDKPV